MSDKKVIGVIPARRGSTRLNDKILRSISGVTLLERVWTQASKCKDLDQLYVATDDQEIYDLANSFGAQVVMTSEECPSGSARVSEALNNLGISWDIALNIQGDMPFIHPEVISDSIHHLSENIDLFDMSTIAIPIIDKEEFLRDASVKVVVNNDGRALYFSRAPIPHSRDGNLWDLRHLISKLDIQDDIYGLKHIGLYVFTPTALQAITEEYQSKLEEVEKLEQLKLIELGYRVGVCVVNPLRMQKSVEIDTEDDVQKAESFIREGEIDLG